MLKATEIAKLKALGFDLAKLEEAFKSDTEHDYILPDVKTYSDEDLSTRDENMRKEGRKEGKKTGIELATKVIADKFSLENVDYSKPDNIVDALNGKLSSGDEVLKTQVKTLQSDKVDLQTKLTASEANHKSALFDRDLIAQFPANRSNTLTDGEYLTLIKGSLQFEDADGKVIVKNGGVPMLDDATRNPLPIDKVLSSVFTERKWLSEGNPGGRGAGDKPNPNGGGFKKMSQVKEAWSSQGKSTTGPEFIAEVNKIAKETTDFDYYN